MDSFRSTTKSDKGKRRANQVTACLCILSFLLFELTACSRPTNNTFISRDPDPLFTFQYPSDYVVAYQPSPFFRDVLLEVRHPRDLLLRTIQIYAMAASSSNAEVARSVFDSRFLSRSTRENISDFTVLLRGISMVNGIEADYVTYSYVESGRTFIGKLTVFNHRNWTWEINGEWDSEWLGEFESVFARILYTFRFLD